MKTQLAICSSWGLSDYLDYVGSNDSKDYICNHYDHSNDGDNGEDNDDDGEGITAAGSLQLLKRQFLNLNDSGTGDNDQTDYSDNNDDVGVG